MSEFLRRISGKVRPVLIIALAGLVIVLYMALSALDHSGMYGALQDAIMLDVPEARMQALFMAMDKLSQTQVHEKIIMAVIIAFAGCISLLSQPVPSQPEKYSEVVRAARAREDEEKLMLAKQVEELSTKLDTLKQALGD